MEAGCLLEFRTAGWTDGWVTESYGDLAIGHRVLQQRRGCWLLRFVTAYSYDIKSCNRNSRIAQLVTNQTTSIVETRIVTVYYWAANGVLYLPDLASTPWWRRVCYIAYLCRLTSTRYCRIRRSGIRHSDNQLLLCCTWCVRVYFPAWNWSANKHRVCCRPAWCRNTVVVLISQLSIIILAPDNIDVALANIFPLSRLQL